MMKRKTDYSIKEVADLAGITVRTLHYYDQIGLLKPQSYRQNGYRRYGEDDLRRLQQILFFRELDFSLEEIKEITGKPGFQLQQALEVHRSLLNDRIQRLNELIRTIDKTLSNLKGELKMSAQEYYSGFSREQQLKYEQEIKDKYGTEALDESKKRMQNWMADDFQRVQAEADKIFSSVCQNMDKGYACTEVQKEIRALHRWLNQFYVCNLEMLLGLGHLYAEHPDFVKMYKTRYHENLPEFLLQAIEYYCKSAHN